MRLFLSSQDFGNHADSLFELLGHGRKVAFIDNAKDDIAPEDKKAHSDGKLVEFESQGLRFEEIDLKSYFGKAGELEQKLRKHDLVWVAGGNTFILRRAMSASGFDTVIKKLLAEDKLVYGGSSAGSVVAGPSLRGAENDTDDSPDVVPDGYDKAVIWEGLGLVPYAIVPHYGSDWYGKESQAMANYLKAANLPYKTLSDGQVILVNGEKTEVLE